MRFHIFRDAVLKKILIPLRLQAVCLWYLISLMVESRKHSLTFASGLSEKDKSAFSKFLMNNKDITKYMLEDLSKKQAGQLADIFEKINGLPWRIAVICDSTLQSRSSLKSGNVQKFNHGKGYVIGHQWTNIILIINGRIIPLPPIPFYSKKYCRKNKMIYKTEHERVREYILNLNLTEYIGWHNDTDIVFLSDSGYDNKNIQNTVKKTKKWHFVCALKSGRSVKSPAKFSETPKSSGWDGVSVFFKKNKWIKWITVRIFTDGPKKKRKDFRIRHACVFLKGVGKVRAVCCEFKKKRDGRRIHIACSCLKAAPRQILIAYRLRWKIEIFHKHIKMHLGFGDVAAKYFTSVESHVYLVYCAYILLHAGLPGIGDGGTIPEKQRNVTQILNNREIACLIHDLTKIGGFGRVKEQLKSALTG